MAVAPSADLAQGQFCASATFDLAQSLSALTRLRVIRAAAAMSRGGLLLCLGGLDRTGYAAAIGAALALAMPALSNSPCAMGTALPKAGPLFGRLVAGTVKLNADLKRAAR